MSLNDIHDFVFEPDEELAALGVTTESLDAYIKKAAKHDSELSAAIQSLDFVDLDEPALPQLPVSDEEELLELDMTITFGDGAQVRVVVTAPDKEHALAALLKTGSEDYLRELAESLDSAE